MTILWEYHFNGHVWLEWVVDGKTKMKKFSDDAFNKFMSEQDELLDFLN